MEGRMSEMVDRICDLLMEHGCGNSEQCEKTARATIAAMREPTEAMVTKVAKGMRNVRYLQDETRETIAIDAWKAMIDAALSDQR
jgi:hypothetical protein